MPKKQMQPSGEDIDCDPLASLKSFKDEGSQSPSKHVYDAYLVTSNAKETPTLKFDNGSAQPLASRNLGHGTSITTRGTS